MKTKPTTMEKKLETANKTIADLRHRLREAEHAYAGMSEELKHARLEYEVYSAAATKAQCVLRIENISLQNLITEVEALLDIRRLPPTAPENKPKLK